MLELECSLDSWDGSFCSLVHYRVGAHDGLQDNVSNALHLCMMAWLLDNLVRALRQGASVCDSLLAGARVQAGVCAGAHLISSVC